MHTGTRYLKTTMREDDLFLSTQPGQPSRASAATEVCARAREGSSGETKCSFLLGNQYGIQAWLSTPALTQLSPGNECSDANGSSPSVRTLGERVAQGTGGRESVVLCRIKCLPKQQEAAQSGTQSNFEVRLYIKGLWTSRFRDY